jgi:hypothetical protein
MTQVMIHNISGRVHYDLSVNFPECGLFNRKDVRRKETHPKNTKLKLNSLALVRERTIPTERPPPVDEVSAKLLRVEGCHVVSATGPHGC